MEGLGYESLYYAHIICESGDTCLLKCAAGACDSNTDYYCLDGATCNLNPRQCLTRSGGTFRGIDCPTIKTSLNEMEIRDIDIKEHIDDEMDMELLFGDIEAIIDNDHHQGNMLINISIFAVIGIALVIFVAMMYNKSNGSDKYLELK